MYNRPARAHELTYEALYRCLLNRMEENSAVDHELATTKFDIQDKVN